MEICHVKEFSKTYRQNQWCTIHLRTVADWNVFPSSLNNLLFDVLFWWFRKFILPPFRSVEYIIWSVLSKCILFCCFAEIMVYQTYAPFQPKYTYVWEKKRLSNKINSDAICFRTGTNNAGWCIYLVMSTMLVGFILRCFFDNFPTYCTTFTINTTRFFYMPNVSNANRQRINIKI